MSLDEQTLEQECQRIIRGIEENDHRTLRTIIKALQPYDLGQVLYQLPETAHREFLNCLTDEEIAELIKDFDHEEQTNIMNMMDVTRTTDVFNAMKSDDVADLLGELEPKHVETYLTRMADDEAHKVRALLHYAEDTAGGLMTHEYVAVYHTFTVQQAIEFLREKAPTAETIYYVYVINETDRLIGVVSLRELLIAKPDTQVQNIMFERVISVPTNTDQEEVARLLERYDFLAIPVVNRQGRLLGIVTVDDIVDVIIEEAHEDITRLSAVGVDRTGFMSPWSATARRLPWLVLLLFIGMLTATILKSFESTIEQVTALTYFMPMIAGMTGNTGTQSLAMVIQGLSTGKISRETVWSIIRREAGVAFLIGTSCSVLIFLIAIVWMGDWLLGAVVGASLWFTLLVGTMAGTLIPLILNLFKVDPTAASGPLITTLNDIFSITIYFSIASFFLHQLLS